MAIFTELSCEPENERVALCFSGPPITESETLLITTFGAAGGMTVSTMLAVLSETEKYGSFELLLFPSSSVAEKFAEENVLSPREDIVVIPIFLNVAVFQSASHERYVSASEEESPSGLKSAVTEPPSIFVHPLKSFTFNTRFITSACAPCI